MLASYYKLSGGHVLWASYSLDDRSFRDNCQAWIWAVESTAGWLVEAACDQCFNLGDGQGF